MCEACLTAENVITRTGKSKTRKYFDKNCDDSQKNLRKKNRDTLNVKEKKIMREDGKHRTEYMKRNGEIGRAGSMWLCTRVST